MCKHNVLAENNHGYILFCNGCGNYQMAFGTSIVNFEPADFRAFCAQITELTESIGFSGSEKKKQIAVNIYCQKAMMILNHIEVFNLSILLGEALFSEEVEFILEECHIKQPGN